MRRLVRYFLWVLLFHKVLYGHIRSAAFLALLIIVPTLAFADCWVLDLANFQAPPQSSAQAALDLGVNYVESLFRGHTLCAVKSGDLILGFEPVVDFYVSPIGVGWSTSDGIPLIEGLEVVPLGAHGEACGYCDDQNVCGSVATVQADNGSYLGGFPECKAYTIKLSRADGSTQDQTNIISVEPADMLSSASGKNASYLLAKVYDQNGQVVPNVNVQLTVDVAPNSGGHKHDVDHDRNTTQMGQLASPQGTVDQNGKVLKGNTGPYGLAFTFTTPGPAGDHIFTATCTDGKNCTIQGPKTIWVGVKDNGQPLTGLPGSPLWVPVGMTGIHPDNHYLTQAALARLTVLAQAYHDQFPAVPELRLNDASLVRGGVFDIDFDPFTGKNGVYRSRTPGGMPGYWWAPPHAEHRRGTVIDIRANGASDAIPAINYKRFEDLVNRLGMNYLHEKDHFHVRLLGIAQ